MRSSSLGMDGDLVCLRSADRAGRRWCCDSVCILALHLHSSRLGGGVSKKSQAVKVWRKRHPLKRNEWRKRNYDKGAGNCRNRGARWSKAEDLRITAEDRPVDRVLALELGRSVIAIQVRRVAIRSFLKP